MEVQITRLNVIITKHAVQRIMERGCSLEEVENYLLRNDKVILFRNHLRGRGYEIIIPFKGRLVGDFEGNIFIARTFKLPFWTNHTNGTGGCAVAVSSVAIRKNRYYNGGKVNFALQRTY